MKHASASKPLFLKPVAAACALLAALAAPGPALAINYTWNSNDSFWDVTTAWSPNGLPTATDNVFIRQVAGANATAKIDAFTGTARAAQLFLGSTLATATATLRQTGGVLETVQSFIGSGGAGTYSHSNGTHRTTDLLLGASTGDTGSYTLDAGTIQASGFLSIGGYSSAGVGSFVQNGGTASAGIFELGFAGGSQGTLTRNAGTFSANVLTLANSGTGTINQLGGNLTIANDATIGQTAGSTGTLRISGGTVSVGNINQFSSPLGTSRLIIDGGSLAVTSGSVRATSMVLGETNGRTGQYTAGPSASVQLGALTVGQAGTGLFVQDAGTVAVSGAINAGVTGSGANGIYRMNGGTLTAGSMTLGGTGGATGTFEKNAGTATISGPLTLGAAGSSGIGRVLVSGGGSLNVNGGLTVLGSGANNELRVAGVSGTSGTTSFASFYGASTFTSSTRVVAEPAGYLYFSSANGGNFVSDGGSVFFASASTVGSVVVAENNSSVMDVFSSLSAGAVTVGAGAGRTGVLSIRFGGSLQPTNTPQLGVGAGSTGILALSGGSLALPGSSLFDLTSNAGTSVLQLNSGSLTFNRFNPGSSSAQISVDQLELGQAQGQSFQLRVVGDRAPGTSFEPNEVGQVFVDQLRIGSSQTSGSMMVVDGGSVTVYEGGSISSTLKVNQGSFYSGATLTVTGRIELADQLQINGLLDLKGQLLGYGQLPNYGGRMANSGAVLQEGGNLRIELSGGVDNTGRWDTAAGYLLELNTTFRNAGTLNLQSGSTITGTGALQNQALGTVQGAGRVQTNTFFNAGRMVAQGGRIEVVNAFVNSGTMVLADDLASYAGGAITNTGRVEGRGVVYNTVLNNAGATVEAKGGTLQLAAAMTNNAGTLTANNGASLVFTGGLTQNTGTIRLNAGIFDNTGRNLDHRGQLLVSTGNSQFLGGLTAATGSKTIVSGLGSLTFYDALDFQSGSELRISAGSVATFFGNVRQRTGALFTGTGQKFYEAAYTIGGSPGLALDDGDVAFGSASNVESEIGGLAAGTGFDQLRVGGALSFGGTLLLKSWDGFVAQAGQSFDLFDWGSVSGSFASIDASGLLLAPDARLDTSRLYVDGSISVVAVPEPQTWALMLLGVVGVVTLRSRATARGLLS